MHTLSSRDNADKRHDSEEKLTEQQSPMASSSRGTGSEDNDSDSDNQSRDDDLDNDDELLAGRQPAEELINEEEERQKQLIVGNRCDFGEDSPLLSNSDPTAEDPVEHRSGMAAQREKLRRTTGEAGPAGTPISNVSVALQSARFD